MPFVQVHWYEGRSDEQKAEIAKRIEAALIEVAGVSPGCNALNAASAASRPDSIA